MGKNIVWVCQECGAQNKIEYCTDKLVVACRKCGIRHLVTGLHISGSPIIHKTSTFRSLVREYIAIACNGFSSRKVDKVSSQNLLLQHILLQHILILILLIPSCKSQSSKSHSITNSEYYRGSSTPVENKLI